MLLRFSYQFFRFASFLRYAFFRRFTNAGRMAVIGAGAAAVLGLDTFQNIAHTAFVFLAALMLLSASAARFRRPRLSLSRVLPRYATVGSPMVYTLNIRNLGNRELSGIAVREDFGDPRPTLTEFLAARDPGGRAAALLGRYRRWRSAFEQRTMAAPPDLDVPDLKPGGERVVKAELLPLKRGILRFRGLSVLQPDPLGLVRSARTSGAEQSLLVLPRQYPIAGVRLGGGRKYHQGGVALASNVGDADEFVSLRDYRHGDPLRSIHWKSWARTGKPVVKEFEDEFFTRHALVLDTFVPEAGPVFEEAVSVSASLVSNTELADSLLDLLFVGKEAYCFTAGRSVGNTDRMLEVLACAEVCPDRPFSDIEALVLGRAALVTSCICVLMAWDGPRKDFVGKLRGLRIPVKVLIVHGPGELRDADAGPMADQPGAFHWIEAGKAGEALRDI